MRLLRFLKLKRLILKIYDLIDSEYAFVVFGMLRLLLVVLVLTPGASALRFAELPWMEIENAKVQNMKHVKT